MPVLAGTKIRVTGDTMTLCTFDYEQSSTAEIPVTGGEDGVIVTPGRILAEVAKALPAGAVGFTPDSQRLTLTTGRSRFSLPLFPTEDYPSIPLTPPTVGTAESDDFIAAVKKVSVAAGRDETVPALCGTLVTFDPAARTVTFVATDRYRLSIAACAYEPAGDATARQVLVPARVLEGYTKAMSTGTTVSLQCSDTLFGVAFDGRSASTRMLDGEFPKYQALLPTTFVGIATVPIHDVSEVVRRVALVAERNAPVRCVFTSGALEVSVGSQSDSSAAETVDVEYDGSEFSIAFNPAYLLDGLATVTGDAAQIKFVASTRPALITPTDDVASQGVAADDDKYLLMPVRVAS